MKCESDDHSHSRWDEMTTIRLRDDREDGVEDHSLAE